MIKRIVSLLVLLLLASAMAASPMVILKQTLGLTDEQTHALQRVLETRQAAITPLLGELQAKEAQLGALLESGSARPEDAGQLVLALRALQQQIALHNETARLAFRQVLTPAQLSQLDAIEGIGAAIRAVEALRLLGL